MGEGNFLALRADPMPKPFLTWGILVMGLGWAEGAPVGAVERAVERAPVGAVELPELRRAAEAMREHLPEVAVVKVRRLLAGGKLGKEARGAALLLLAEALVRAGRPGEVLAAAGEAAWPDQPEAVFWKAQALAQLDRWREAEEALVTLASLKDFAWAVEVAFSRAGMLGALGETERARRVLTPLLQEAGSAVAERATLWLAELRLMEGQAAEAAALWGPGGAAGEAPPRQYLRARIALAAGEAKAAEAGFAAVAAEHSGAPVRLQQAARLGRARALRVQGQKSEALAGLRQLISATPVPAAEVLDVAFQELEVMNREPTAETQAFLKALGEAADPGLKIRARMALAAALESMGDPLQAGAAWAAIPRDFPEHPLRALALLREAQFLTGQSRRDEARPLLEQLRQLSPSPAVAAWTAWVAGQAEYDAAAYRAASGYFLEASAKSPDAAVRAAAIYNAALAELQSGTPSPSRSLALLEGSSLGEYAGAGAEFHLERALRLASRGDAAAVAGLEAVAEAVPGHPRRFEALIALAELALRSDPPRSGEAGRQLAAARGAAAEPGQQERVGLLGCYLAEAEGGPDAMERAAAVFLRDFPKAAARTDLRMKVAQGCYQRENFSGAKRLFEEAAADDPMHPLAESALFWAGRAALLTLEPSAAQQAVVLWERVFQGGGPLKWQARLQEALLNQRQRQGAAALQLLEEILRAKPGPAVNTRWQALSVRGELLAVPGQSPEEQARGLQSFDEVLEAEGLPGAWRSQTLVRKGVCLEALQRSDEALEAYYEVLRGMSREEVPPEGGAEDYWFHRAGDKARRLLEAAGKYEEAIEIAKKLAKAPGPRGRAAAELVDELALKYGIWTSSP